MKVKEAIKNEVDNLPENILEEVSDFIQFLKTKIVKEHIATAILSESSLKKEWLGVEEDKAWQNL